MVKKDYEGEHITVHWDSERCIHSAICLGRSPSVFDTRSRPWIDVTGASHEEIANTVASCPSGALKFTSEHLDETLPEPAVARAIPGGPMIIRGHVEVVDQDGTTLCSESRVALCRCGRSSNQPFCDSSHKAVEEYEDPDPAVYAPGDGDLTAPKRAT